MYSSDYKTVLVQFLAVSHKTLQILKWYLTITSETCSDESQASVLGIRHAVEVLVQYFMYDPALFPNTIIS